MKKLARHPSGSTLIEVMVAVGVLGLIVLGVNTTLGYIQNETLQVDLRVSREHAVMSYLDSIRKNLSLYQANFNPCLDYDNCGSTAAADEAKIVNCNSPLQFDTPQVAGQVPDETIVYWDTSGTCTKAEGCPGMMQVNIQPFGDNASGQRGFFVVNLTVCHKKISNGFPTQYEYLVTSE